MFYFIRRHDNILLNNNVKKHFNKSPKLYVKNILINILLNLLNYMLKNILINILLNLLNYMLKNILINILLNLLNYMLKNILINLLNYFKSY